MPHVVSNELQSRPLFLTTLASNVLNTGNAEIYLNYSQINMLMNNDWSLLYPNLSNISHIISIIIESTEMINGVPIKYRIASKLIQHIVLNESETNSTRRRLTWLTDLTKSGGRILKIGLKEAKNFVKNKTLETLKRNGFHCMLWSEIDTIVMGIPAYMKFRNLQPCPQVDPKRVIRSGRCEGRWKNLDAWETRLHPSADNCIKSSRGRECCYKKGKLCSDPPCAGRARLMENEINLGAYGTINIGPEGLHYYADVLPYLWCKAADKNPYISNAFYMNRYYARRPRYIGTGGARTAQE
eukprot:232010_1